MKGKRVQKLIQELNVIGKPDRKNKFSGLYLIKNKK